MFADDQFETEDDNIISFEEDPVLYPSDVAETSLFHQEDNNNDDENIEEGSEDQPHAGLGGGWGRILYMPHRRGRQVSMDICRATKRDASEGALQRLVVTQSKNPALHFQARRSIWGDLWPF